MYIITTLLTYCHDACSVLTEEGGGAEEAAGRGAGEAGRRATGDNGGCACSCSHACPAYRVVVAWRMQLERGRIGTSVCSVNSLD